MASSTDVLRIAKDQLGTTSGKKYWDFVFNGSMSYVNGAQTPYCACFVSWVFDKAGAKVPGLPAAYCPYICRDGNSHGITVSKYSAIPGDIVLFDWDLDGLSDHVGIVESNQGTYLQTIEGNTSGGIVARRTRNFGNVCHVIRPNYSKSEGIDEDLVVDGWAGPLTVTKLQQAVKVPSKYIDGILSGQSVANKDYLGNVWSCTWDGLGSYTVETMQGMLSLPETGLWNKAFSKALQQHLINRGYSCGDAGVDGYFGYYSCCALQEALNDGKLF